MALEPRYLLQEHPRPYSALFTDHYSHTMSWAFKLLDLVGLITRQGVSAREIWSTRITQRLYFRRLPFGGGYAVQYGVRAALDHLLNMNLTYEEAEWLVEQVPFKGGPYESELRGLILESVDQYLFNGDVWGIAEGELVFPNLPLLVVSGNPLEVAIAEGALLSCFNSGIGFATKARRICNEARHPETGERLLVADFALRRMMCGLLGTPFTSEALIAGGMASTSNDMAAFLHRRDVWEGTSYPIKAVGTHAHLWITIWGSDPDGFESYSEAYPHAAAFLGDTFDHLKLGVPAAIEEIKRLRVTGYEQFILIRDDSGDLAYKANEAVKLIVNAELKRVGIIISSDLDEYRIRAILGETLHIVAFGVGTKAVTGLQSPGCVYKTVQLVLPDGRIIPIIKIASAVKTTIPGRLQAWRLYDLDGMMLADALAGVEAGLQQIGSVEIIHPTNRQDRTTVEYVRARPLVQQLVSDGRLLVDLPPAMVVQRLGWEHFERLHLSHKRLGDPSHEQLKPHPYRVGITPEVHEVRERLITEKRA